MRPSHVHVPQGTSELNLAALVRAASSSDMGASGSMPPPSVSAISESASETNPDPQRTRSGSVRVTYGTLPSDAPLEPSLLAPRRPADPPLAHLEYGRPKQSDKHHNGSQIWFRLTQVRT